MDQSPYARHRAGVREAKRALNERLHSGDPFASSGGSNTPNASAPGSLPVSVGAAALGAEEWSAWSRCRQVGVPLAAAPGSAALAALAFAVATAVGRAPGAAARAVLDTRASLALSAGLLVFNHQTGPTAPLSERCYVHVLAGNSEAGAAMRAAYRAAAGDDDFVAAAEGFARALDGLPPKRAGAAAGASVSTGSGASASSGSGAQSRYPRTDFSDRLHAVMQYAPMPTSAPARGGAAALQVRSPAHAEQAAHGEESAFGRDDERRGFDDLPAPQAVQPAVASIGLRRQQAASAQAGTAPRWVIEFGDESTSTDDARGSAAPAVATLSATHDPEPSWVARARRREQLFAGGRGGGLGGGLGSGASASSGLA
jgi:hypothetical protein